MMMFVHFHLVDAVDRRILRVRLFRLFFSYFIEVLVEAGCRVYETDLFVAHPRPPPPRLHGRTPSPFSTHVCPNASISSAKSNALIDSSTSSCYLTNSRAILKSSVFCSVGPPKDSCILSSCSFTKHYYSPGF